MMVVLAFSFCAVIAAVFAAPAPDLPHGGQSSSHSVDGCLPLVPEKLKTGSP